MSGQMRLMLIAGVILATIMALLATGSAGAATIEGHWSMYARQDATSFRAGTTPFAVPDTLPGYEIVGMDAKGVTESMDTYQYWGASHVPPVPEIVSCSATIAPPVMSLSVQGAYPFGGCVFFLGVTNAGDTDLRVDLGPAPGDTLPVACFGGPCVASDVDVLAGGHTQADIAERCAIIGTGPGGVVPVGDTLSYLISPEYTFVCPLFVVVMQPACEDCDYTFEITPEPTETPTTFISTETPPLISETQVTVGDTPTPTNTATPVPPTATPTPESPTPTPTEEATATPTLTPVDDVGGVRTPGAATATPTRTPASSGVTVVPTPRPPSSGTGVLVRRTSDEPHSIVPIGLVALATILCLAIAWPANRESANASQPTEQAAGGSTSGYRNAARIVLARMVNEVRRIRR